MNEAQLQTPDFIVIIGYFAILLAIGIYLKRFMLGAGDYFTGGNRMPWWLAGVSYYMTTFSAFAFVAYGEVAFTYGWVAVTLGWVSVPACLFAARWTASRWRRARVGTPVELLEARFSPFFRQLFAWTGFPLRIADDGLRLYSLGVFVSVAMGLDILWAITISAVVLLVYTFLGGLWAVAVTDFIQGVVLFLALFIIFPLALIRGGGFGQLAASAPSEGYLGLFNSPYSAAYVLGFFILILLNYNAGWALVQRFYSVADDGEARKVALLAAGLNVIGPPLFYLPVMLSRDLLAGLENTRNAYAAMSMELLPVGMMGVMITAMFAATMSTLSSEYNVLASVATRDIYARLFRPDATEEHLLRMGRIFTLLIGVVVLGVGVIVALYPDTPLFSIMVTVFGVAVGPMMLPLLGGLFFRSLSRRGAMFGFLVGLTVGFATLAVQRLYLPRREGLDPEWITFEFGAYAIFINVGVTVLAMVLYTAMERRGEEEVERSRAFFARLETPLEVDKPAADGGTGGPSAFPVTGLGIIGVGLLLVVAAFFTATRTGMLIDLVAGATLLAVGWILFRTRPSPAAGDRVKAATR